MKNENLNTHIFTKNKNLMNNNKTVKLQKKCTIN